MIQQRKDDKNKIYSLHKPFTCCIAKGKAHKPYEIRSIREHPKMYNTCEQFGNKIGLMINPQSLVILGIDSFEGIPHDRHTIEPLLNQVERNFQYKPQEVVYDRGGRGRTEINGVKISTANKPLKRDSEYVKRTKRKKFRRRAAIEPVIGHLKQHFRMGQNYLHGDKSPKINALLAAAAWNFKKLMEKIKLKSKNFFFEILQQLFFFEIPNLKTSY